MKFPKNLILVFLTVFIDCLGNSLTIPIMPFLMSDLGGGSEELGILYSSYCITQIFSVWIMGTLSDKYGRKLFLIISLFGSWCGPLLQALSPNIPMLIAMRALTGLLGGSMTVAQAYIADSTTVEERSPILSQLNGISCLSFLFGPMIGGLLGQISLRYPFYVSAVCSFLVFVTSIFGMKETNHKVIKTRELKNERRKINKSKISLSANDKKRLEEIDVEIKEINKPRIALLACSIAIVPKDQAPKAHWNSFMVLSLIQRFCNESGSALSGTVFGVYLVDEAGYSSLDYSIFLCVTSIIAFLTPTFIYPFLLKRCKCNIIAIGTIGGLIMGIGYACASFSHTYWDTYLSVIFLTFGFSLGTPLCSTLLSVQSPPEVQGSVLAIGSMTSPISGIIIPVTTGYVYAVSHQGAVLIGSVLGGVIFIVCMIIYCLPGGKDSANPREEKKEEDFEEKEETPVENNKEEKKEEVPVIIPVENQKEEVPVIIPVETEKKEVPVIIPVETQKEVKLESIPISI